MTHKARWVVYMLLCEDGSLYTGCTTNLDRRMRQHRGELRGGARYTKSHKPRRVIARLHAHSRAEAQRMEAKWKRLSPREKRLVAQVLQYP